MKIYPFAVCYDCPTGCTAARKPHRVHIFHYDVADWVALIMRMQPSIGIQRDAGLEFGD